VSLKKNEEEGQNEEGITSPEVIDTLVQLLTEADDLGRREGIGLSKTDYTRSASAKCRDYPQYESIRSIGEKLYRLHSSEALQLNYNIIMLNDIGRGILLGFIWDGIGGWKA
jgi:hypothetical protein